MNMPSDSQHVSSATTQSSGTVQQEQSDHALGWDPNVEANIWNTSVLPEWLPSNTKDPYIGAKEFMQLFTHAPTLSVMEYLEKNQTTMIEGYGQDYFEKFRDRVMEHVHFRDQIANIPVPDELKPFLNPRNGGEQLNEPRPSNLKLPT